MQIVGQRRGTIGQKRRWLAWGWLFFLFVWGIGSRGEWGMGTLAWFEGLRQADRLEQMQFDISFETYHLQIAKRLWYNLKYRKTNHH